LISAGHTQASRSGVLAMLLVPVAGRRLRLSLVRPSRFWLEPPAI
jgi:hypothetical protein